MLSELQRVERHQTHQYLYNTSRLKAQYVLKKRITGLAGAVPTSVDVSHVREVLDVAAGTCAWTLDLASMPEIKSRLDRPGCKPVRESVRLFACDIDSKFMPGKDVTDPLGITTFSQDITKPFPEEFHGRFDLVHMSLLFLCLTETGWEDALHNCRQVLSAYKRSRLGMNGQRTHLLSHTRTRRTAHDRGGGPDTLL